jgi:nicotinate-nucleotide--dimethylbenzimidazole phosphoribosyltransferase
MNRLEEILNHIEGKDDDAAQTCLKRINCLIKPKGSLGKLEEMVVKLAGIQRNPFPSFQKKAVVVCAGDHKIIEEGVATSKKDITRIQAINMTRGLTGVCALSKSVGAEVVVVDLGIDNEVPYNQIINKKIKYGADNFMKGPAMTYEEAQASILAGFDVATELIKNGVNLLATGEMGIGNTTPSSAIVSVLTNTEVALVTGIGANLPLDRVKHKAMVIEKAILLNQPNPQDPIDVLSKVGGLEIGGMCGVMLAGAYHRVPVVVDGFISSAAALIATKLNTKVRDYLFGSHNSIELGAQVASKYLQLDTYLDMNMRLGEGSGAVLMFSILESAVSMNNVMITFEEAGFIVD